MKLIDKEALLLALRKKRYSKQSLDLIESQPVVDSIPIEWIVMQLDVFDDGFYDLRLVIEHWEKENADNN